MSTTRLINVEQICEIRIYRKSINRYYSYQSESKSFFGKLTEHHYNFHLGLGITKAIGTVSKEDKNLYEEMNEDGIWVVYYKPHLELEMSSGNTKTIWYETVEEMEAGLELISRNVKWV